MSYGSVIYELAEELGEVLKSRQIRMAIAESCTGGSLGATITSIPGSAEWFEGGFITYSNTAKTQMLGIPQPLIEKYGAVSEETARAMAEGVITHTEAQVSVAITGIAGPTGGSKEKPVGTVWIAWAGDLQPTFSHCYHFQGNRPAVRHQAVQTALEGLKKRCSKDANLKNQGKENYFFALIPDDKTADSIVQQSKKLIDAKQCSVTPKSKLHLTLVYLEAVSSDFIQEVMRKVAQIKVKQFEMCLNQAGSWSRSKTCWLGSSHPPAELFALVEQLNKNLLALGFKPERKTFSPHVTIARKCSNKKTKTVPDIAWSVNSFCLMKSTQHSGTTHYETIASWLLQN